MNLLIFLLTDDALLVYSSRNDHSFFCCSVFIKVAVDVLLLFDSHVGQECNG